MDLSDGGRSPRHGAVVRGQTQKFLTPAAKSFVAGTSLPWTTETGCGRVCTPGKSVCGEQAAVRRQEGRLLRHQAQFPHTPSGVQGAQVTARLKKNDGTTMACGGHWHTTPAQVKTEKTARHL
ncbi:TPA: hypothetical protein RM919_003482 [Escherichia coli]|nr:hypothetical protein [Escherichia coli]HDW8347284.1 hypothetical protein [Escherichia coli]HDW8401525.1 hypothetical protein [Escherichia coli]